MVKKLRRLSSGELEHEVMMAQHTDKPDPVSTWSQIRGSDMVPDDSDSEETDSEMPPLCHASDSEETTAPKHPICADGNVSDTLLACFRRMFLERVLIHHGPPCSTFAWVSGHSKDVKDPVKEFIMEELD